jgi:uncharacterized protein (TIGR03790 family)
MAFALFRGGRPWLEAIVLMLALNASASVWASDIEEQPAESPRTVSPAKADGAEIFQERGVSAQTMGVVVNVQDTQSVALARVYMRERKIPSGNLIAVSFAPKQSSMSPEAFAAAYRAFIEPLDGRIQALVLTWAKPYKVGCMSITSAFAFGFSEAYCASGCKPTKVSPYFDSKERSPWTAHRMRPTMMLASNSMDGALDLISRGLAADDQRQVAAKAFVLQTSDAARSVRSLGHPQGETKVWADGAVTLKYAQAPALRGQKDVLAYFTGAASVQSLHENLYLPGAVGDHLTSFGGVLDGNTGQMTALEWIRYGMTGSYGTVVEPCNFPDKFPNPEVFLDRYTLGDTLIEAYWKSVFMPGQGLFVGEPLARPFFP